MTQRIAMWSGPRNISTAMMRSWENRADCSVVDEPFYACYLERTQSPHPMFDEILQSQPIDYAEVACAMSQGDCISPLQYQKHMTHHMQVNCDLAWTKDIKHCFLIRQPAHIVHSYTISRGVCTAEDIGIIRQYELYKEISDISGQDIPVVDSDAVLKAPEKSLRSLCTHLGVSFDNKMLNWPMGRRDTDGVWARHWYRSVEQSTEFGAAKQQTLNLSPSQQAVVDEVTPYYQKLKQRALII